MCVVDYNACVMGKYLVPSVGSVISRRPFWLSALSTMVYDFSGFPWALFYNSFSLLPSISVPIRIGPCLGPIQQPAIASQINYWRPFWKLSLQSSPTIVMTFCYKVKHEIGFQIVLAIVPRVQIVL